MMDATIMNPMKFLAVFSYCVATRRYCFSLNQNRSTKFRSLYRSRSCARCTLRFFWDEITASAPCASIASTTALLSYPLSPITTAMGTSSINAFAWVTSAAWPGVRINFTGRPSPLTPPCVFVPNPPRLRPDVCSSWPPVPSAFFGAGCARVRSNHRGVDYQPLEVGIL